MKKLIWILMAVLVVSIAINVWQCSHHPEESTAVEHDTVWRDTTIHEPHPAETVQTGRVVYIRIPTAKPTDVVRDTIHDSIEVPVPIVQKRYEDSLFTAWVSGYEPALDSIRLYQPIITNTVTITKTIKGKVPRLSFGVETGAGIGVFSRQPDVYVGVGLHWRLW